MLKKISALFLVFAILFISCEQSSGSNNMAALGLVSPQSSGGQNQDSPTNPDNPSNPDDPVNPVDPDVIYTITFSWNGTTYTQTVHAGQEIQLLLNTFSVDGYMFDGWSLTQNGSVLYSDGATIKTDKDITLYPVWRVLDSNSYFIKFEPNGGTGAMALMQIPFGTGKKLTQLGLTRHGYDFTGWNTELYGGGTSYVDTEYVEGLTGIAAKVITLYAQWKAWDFCINYETYESKWFIYGTSSELMTPHIVGYDFLGWTLEEESTDYVSMEYCKAILKYNNQTITLYPHFEYTGTEVNGITIGAVEGDIPAFEPPVIDGTKYTFTAPGSYDSYSWSLISDKEILPSTESKYKNIKCTGSIFEFDVADCDIIKGGIYQVVLRVKKNGYWYSTQYQLIIRK